MSRYVLNRQMETRETAYGPIQIKHASGMGTEREKPEYQDIAAAAEKHGLTLEEIRKALR
jgi:uncharacterized protein (DUF111 family)